MKLIHFESGLGNQMLNCAEYLAMKYANPNDEVLIEKYVYDIPEVNAVINHWNGYEIENIFGFHLPDIREKMSDAANKRIINSIKSTEFWNDMWNYPEAILNPINAEGFRFQNTCKSIFALPPKGLSRLKKEFFLGNSFISLVKRMIVKKYPGKYENSKAHPEKLYMKSENDLYTGQTSLFMYNGNHIELIEDEIRQMFSFPDFSIVLDDSDENVIKKNRKAAEMISSCNAVAIHVRRGDALGVNGYVYRSGYFRRAVRYIKDSVHNPVFFFFSDPGTVEWCRTNISLFGLTASDKMQFITWNRGKESYRDMQLMSLCRHNIITLSSFGWWGSYLNQHTDKITCSPHYYMNTTHHF